MKAPEPLAALESSGPQDVALEHFMINEAKVAFCAGYEFGKQGEAFLRMNVACPRCTLTKALEQMEKAINGLSLQ